MVSVVLCHLENFAQTAKSLRGTYLGSVVENDKLSGAVGILYKSPVADFKTQVKQWLAAEAKAVQNLGENAIHDRHNRTVLVVSFGVWDLWNMIEKNYETATKSVDYSVEVIMEQLDMLSENWGSDDLKIILTLVRM